MQFTQRVIDTCAGDNRPEGDLDILGLSGALGEGQAAQRHSEFLIGSKRIAGERHADCLLEGGSLNAVVCTQVLVELIAVEVTQNCLRATGQRREGVTTCEQEGNGSNRVVLVHINGCTIDQQRGNALAVRLRGVVGVLNILRQAKLEQRARVLRVQVRLPLFFQSILHIGALDGYISQLVREGHDIVALLVGDGAIATGFEIRTQTTGIDHADINGVPIGCANCFTHCIGSKVAQRRFDTAVTALFDASIGGLENTAVEALGVSTCHNFSAGYCRGLLRAGHDGLCLGVFTAFVYGCSGDQLGIGLNDLSGRRVVGDLDQAQVIRVGTRGHTREKRICRGERDRRIDVVELVRHVRVTAHEAVNIGAHLRVVILHVIIEHGDDDLRGSILLELLCQGIDLGDRIVEGQTRSGSGAELIGHVPSNCTNKCNRHPRGRGPQLVLSQIRSSRAPGSHSVNVCSQVGEIRLNKLRGVRSINTLLEDSLPHIELMVTHGRCQGVHRIEGLDGRVVLQRTRSVGRCTNVVTQQGEA